MREAFNAYLSCIGHNRIEYIVIGTRKRVHSRAIHAYLWRDGYDGVEYNSKKEDEEQGHPCIPLA